MRNATTMDVRAGQRRRAVRLIVLAFVLLAGAAALTALAAEAMPTWTPLSPNVTDLRTSATSFPITAAVSPANATVTVNGVPSTPDAGGNVSVTIPLAEGLNLVNFTATDWLAENASLIFQIDADQTAPQVSLTPLEDQTITNIPTLSLQALMDEHGTAQVNGMDMSTPDGFHFMLDYALLDGLNVLYFHFEDDVGNTVDLGRQVTFDQYPPYLQVDSPADGALVNFTSLQVLGRTEREASVTINGAPATVSPINGSFFAYVLLDDIFSQTENLLVIRAVDPAGNAVYQNRTVWVDTQSPSVDIDLPVEVRNHIEEGTPFNAEVLALRGITDSVDATILVAGEAATMNGLSWNLTVQLVEGENLITIEAFDVAGNHRYVTVIAIRDTLVPALVVHSPASNSVHTNQLSLHLAGNVTGEDAVSIRILYMDPRGVQMIDTPVTTLEADGSLSFSWDLGQLNSDANEHSVEIQASDAAGNVASFSFVYVCRVGMPFLEIVGFRDVVDSPFVWVNGTTDAYVSSVRINGEEFEVVDQYFTVRWPLANPGNYTITVVVEDDAGNTNTQTVTVRYELPPQVPSSLELRINMSSDLNLTANESRVFSLDGVIPSALGVTWYVDGTIASYDRSITLSLDPGEHNVTVVVSNATVSRTFTFTVTARAPAAGPSTPAVSKPAPSIGGELLIVAIAAGAAAALVIRRRARPPQGK